jgi:hypothetical protein
MREQNMEMTKENAALMNELWEAAKKEKPIA